MPNLRRNFQFPISPSTPRAKGPRGNFQFAKKHLSLFPSYISPISGFTLIELLAVFAIMSITAGIGFVSLVAYSRSQTSSQTVSDIKQAIETARFNALSSVKPPPPACAVSDQLKSYTISFCYNGNPNCNGTDSQGTSIPSGTSYLIRVQCGNKDVLVTSRKFPAGVIYSTTKITTCQNLIFNANTANASMNANACMLYLSGNSAIDLTVSDQGYVTY